MIDARFHIGFCAPSRVLSDPAGLEAIEAFWRRRGADVTFDRTVRANVKQFGGTDAQRLEGLMAMIRDPSINVVMPIRGGYGMTRLLDAIDYDEMARYRPILCGFSDFTALNMAYFAHTGSVSYQGPTGTSFTEPLPSLTETSFYQALCERQWRVTFESPSAPECECQGILWGGNLTMIASLVGTPHFPKIEGGLLYLEDVHERAYRLERLLLQLDMAGVLSRQQAIILGDFMHADPLGASPDQFLLADVIAFLRGRVPHVPLILGLPFGHTARRVTMPFGAKACLSVKQSRVTLTSTDHPIIQKDG